MLVIILIATISSAACFHSNVPLFVSRLPLKVIASMKPTATLGKPKPPAWEFLDEIYLVTTSGANNNRLGMAKSQLEEAGLWDGVTVRTFPVDTADKVRGCYNSHIAVLQEIQNKYKWKLKRNYHALILEDNLETAQGMQIPEVLQSVRSFITQSAGDVCYLAYMMYVPGMSLKRIKPATTNGRSRLNMATEGSIADVSDHVVQMRSQGGSAVVGTTAYIISASGVDKILRYDRENKGYVSGEAIPNVMAKIFASTRFAAYPMLFHRSGTVLYFSTADSCCSTIR